MSWVWDAIGLHWVFSGWGLLLSVCVWAVSIHEGGSGYIFLLRKTKREVLSLYSEKAHMHAVRERERQNAFQYAVCLRENRKVTLNLWLQISKDVETTWLFQITVCQNAFILVWMRVWCSWPQYNFGTHGKTGYKSNMRTFINDWLWTVTFNLQRFDDFVNILNFLHVHEYITVYL